MSFYNKLLELIGSVPQTSTFSVSPYPTYTDKPVNLPSLKQDLKAVRDFAQGQKDYITSKQFPIDVVSQNVGLGLGAAAGTPFGLTLPGAIIGGGIGGFVGNQIKNISGYPQTGWGTVIDTITGAIPGNIDNGLSLGLYAGKKAKGFPKEIIPDDIKTLNSNFKLPDEVIEGNSDPILHTIPISKLDIPVKGANETLIDIAQDRLSKTNGPIDVFYDRNLKQLGIIDGYHRVFEAARKKIPSIDANITSSYSDIRPVYKGEKTYPLSNLYLQPELKGQFSSIHDKLPRFEIDDSGAKIKDIDPVEYTKLIPNSKGGILAARAATLPVKLQDILDHPELYKNYPEAKNIDVNIDGSLWNNTGKFNEDGISIARKNDISTLLHELQHYIQKKEGFNRGNSGYNPNYKNFTGEIEARDVQSRMGLNPNQRFFSTPNQGGYLQSQGIPTQDFITRFDNSGVSALQSMPKKVNPSDLVAQHPDLNLKRDVPIKDIHGNKAIIPQGEALTPYELKGGKVLLKDGEEYIVSKNQYQNVKGNAHELVETPFAPELGQIKENIKGYGESGYGEPKFGKYTLPGGRDYKEILLQDTKNGDKFDISKLEIRRDRHSTTQGTTAIVYDGKLLGSYADNPLLSSSGEYFQKPDEYWTKVAEKVFENGDMNNGIKPLSHSFKFQSSHWSEPNVLAHLRLNQREYQGKPVTFLEEIQSDWANKGRKEGFQEPQQVKKQLAIRPATNGGSGYEYYDTHTGQAWGVSTTQQGVEEMMRNHLQSHPFTTKGVPNSPLLKDWQSLALKRALKEAVDSKSEYLAWTTGAQQAERYNLAKYVDDIRWDETASNGRSVLINPTGAQGIKVLTDPQGKIVTKGGNIPDDWYDKHISEVVGKEHAAKILNSPKGTLSGEGLSIGGQWANNLYDQQIPNTIEKLTGGMIEPLDLGIPIEKPPSIHDFYHTNPGGDQSLNPVYTREFRKGLPIHASINNGPTHAYIVTDVTDKGTANVVPIGVYRGALGQLLKQRGNLSEETLKEGMKFADQYLEFLDLDKFKTPIDIGNTIPQSQQGIRLTPEIIAKIQGKIPDSYKRPSGISPFAQ